MRGEGGGGSGQGKRLWCWQGGSGLCLSFQRGHEMGEAVLMGEALSVHFP